MTNLLDLYNQYKKGHILSDSDTRRLNSAIEDALKKFSLEGEQEMWREHRRGIKLSPTEMDDLDDSITEALAVYINEDYWKR